MNRFILFLFVVAFASSVSANTLNLDGTYKGHNLYLHISCKDAGIRTLYYNINDSIRDTLKSGDNAVELNLARYTFPLKTHLKISIRAKGDCMIKLLNAQMDEIYRPARFLTINASKESKTLRWSVAEDTVEFNYFIEQFRWNKWMKIGTVPSLGKKDTMMDNFDLSTWIHSGPNKFRIKACTPFCFYSREVTLEGPSPPADDIPSRYKGKPIEFPSETYFELYDAYGNIVKKGRGKSIDLIECPRGLYYLAYDNKIVDLVKH